MNIQFPGKCPINTIIIIFSILLGLNKHSIEYKVRSWGFIFLVHNFLAMWTYVFGYMNPHIFLLQSGGGGSHNEIKYVKESSLAPGLMTNLYCIL